MSSLPKDFLEPGDVNVFRKVFLTHTEGILSFPRIIAHGAVAVTQRLDPPLQPANDGVGACQLGPSRRQKRDPPYHAVEVFWKDFERDR